MTEDRLRELLELVPDPPEELMAGARRWFRRRLELERELIADLDSPAARRIRPLSLPSADVERRLAARAFKA